MSKSSNVLFSPRVLFPTNTIIHRLEALVNDTALVDRALTAVGNTLDLAVAVHIFEIEVAAVDDIVDYIYMGVSLCFSLNYFFHLYRNFVKNRAGLLYEALPFVIHQK